MARRRYVFWRAPDGRPHRKDPCRHAPTALLAELGNLASLDEHDNVTWPAFRVVSLNEALSARVAVQECPDAHEVNDVDTWAIISSTVTEVIRRLGPGKPIPPAEFLSVADKKAGAHFRSRAKTYVLLTSLSVKTFPSKQITMHECQIPPLASRRRFHFPDTVHLYNPSDTPIGIHLRSSEYQLVRVSTTGRTIFEAADSALYELSLLRGLWSLFATYGSWSIGSSPQRPGVIHLGPLHTLYNSDSSPASNRYWYEPDYVRDQPLYQPRSGWKDLERHRRWAVRRINRLPYRIELERLIARYASSLDQTNLNVAFLQMWSILEKLTDTVGRRYDETISRAVWPFEDLDLQREILHAVRVRRNQFVHSAEPAPVADQATYMVKQFVDPHLVRLIANEGRVASLEDYGRQLALPTSLDELRAQRQSLNRAIRFRTRTSS